MRIAHFSICVLAAAVFGACQSSPSATADDDAGTADVFDGGPTRVDTSDWEMDCTVDEDCIVVDNGNGNCTSCCPEDAIRVEDRERFIEERNALWCDSDDDSYCFCGSDFVARCVDDVCRRCEATDDGEVCDDAE